ncbi:hypothetical protein TSOC_000734 [Tetrabaena socialis]|uniref:Uncharacterized protein n=1 Tax=Tetrabaena socialis TaxID=47790 RepID=A0A2J8AIL8_9CHLO|nr:hypothetical protein TSOC_000734 [Tetrabaena socialis]|eukprot:PNH12362.1 hypothetical protein TSOC_000734 [Tetrabaena socialis]
MRGGYADRRLGHHLGEGPRSSGGLAAHQQLRDVRSGAVTDATAVAAAASLLAGLQAGGAMDYQEGEIKLDGTASLGTRVGKSAGGSAGGSAKGGAKGQGQRKAPSQFPLALGFATGHHEACGLHHATAVSANKRGTATFNINCPRFACGTKSRVGDISDVKEYPTLKMAQDALERDRNACSKCVAAEAKAAAGPS